MIILAIDPGTKQSAYVLYEWYPTTEDPFGGDILEKGIERNEDLLNTIGTFNSIDRIAIEMIGHYGLGMAVGKEVFQTCVWIGRYWQHARTHGLQESQIEMVMRREIKLFVCGDARAKDPNIRQALLDAFGPAGTKKAPGKTYGVTTHIWSALAVAVASAAGKGRAGFQEK
jgi:hypothetical protein